VIGFYHSIRQAVMKTQTCRKDVARYSSHKGHRKHAGKSANAYAFVRPASAFGTGSPDETMP